MDAMLEGIIDEVTAVLIDRESTIAEPERASLAAALKGEADSLVCVIERPGRQGDHTWVALGPLDADPESYPAGRTLGTQRVARLVHSYPTEPYEREWPDKKLREIGGTYPDLDVFTTEQVAAFFRSRTKGLPDLTGLSPTLAGVSRHSRALMAIGGDLPEGGMLGPPEFLWYDLAEVSIGQAVWRTSWMGTLRVFRREAEATWRAFAINGGTRWASGMGDSFRGAMIAYRALQQTTVPA